MPHPLIEPIEPRRLFAATFYVSPAGDDASPGDDPARAWRTVQRAFDAATPGSTVLVQPGVYREKVTLRVSGTAADGPVRFVADGPAGSVVLSGRGRAGDHVVHVVDKSYVSIEGFDVRDNLGVRDGSGIRVEGRGDHISLLNNRIHRMRGRNAMGITVYGTDPAEGVHDLTIDGNEVFDCRAAPSEALVLNGNVSAFAVTNNVVRDVNNIGIDFIGGEGVCPDPATDQARDGVCRGNRVDRARSAGGFAAGIYVDGGRDILVERNVVTRSDLGIEVGCENAGRTATNVTVRDNLLTDNLRAGLVFGGFESAAGRVNGCAFLNNTLYHNGTKRRGGAGGELWVQLGSGNRVANNLIVGTGRRPLLVNDQNDPAAAADPTSPNQFDYNLYFADPTGRRPVQPRFVVTGTEYETLTDYATAAGDGREAAGAFADPRLTAPTAGDFRPAAGSPAVDAGDPTFSSGTGETDLAGGQRLLGARVDLGAYEVG